MENYIIHFHHANIQITDASHPLKEQLIRLVDNAVVMEDEEEEWRPLVQLLVAALNPVCICKIEHAASTPEQPPYVNLIVLLPGSDHTPITEYEPLLQLARLGGERTQCSFHRFHTLVQWIAEGHPFYCKHIVKQNLVYDDGSRELPVADPALTLQMKAVLIERFRVLLREAKEFYQCAGLLYAQQNRTTIVAFMLHQTVELGYRSVLESLNNYCPKTHSIRRLKNLALRCAPVLGELFPDDSEVERQLMQTLEDAYSLARYDRSYSISSEDVAQLMQRTELFLQKVEALFQHN